MAFFHRHEHSPACGANLAAGAQCALDGRTVISDLNNLGREKDEVVRRCRSQHFDGVLRSDCARRAIFPCTFHQVIRCRPVAMAVE